MFEFRKKRFFRNEFKPNFIQNFAVRMLEGNKPKNVAIIMDGNRRWAQVRNLSPTSGHDIGCDKLIDSFNWMIQLDITEVTYYCFSIDNFKRKQNEIDGLMEIFVQLFDLMLREIEEFMVRGIRVNVIADLDLLPSKLCKLCSKVMLLTFHNTKHQLNLAIAYTSSHENARILKSLRSGISDEILHLSDIDEHLIERCMKGEMKTSPSFLLRTSGEQRFSDFMLWQLSGEVIHFCDVYWPDLSFTNLLAALFYYQFYDYIGKNRKKRLIDKQDEINAGDSLKHKRTNAFIAKKRDEFIESLQVRT